MAFIALATGFVLAESVLSRRADPALREHTACTWPSYAAGPLLYLIFAASALGCLRAAPPTQALGLAAGASLMTAGIGIRSAALQTLGPMFRNHVAVVERHRLIDTGIYAIVRHPSELGLLLIALGAPILLSSTVGFALACVLIPVSLARIALEDGLLRTTFPDRFADYKRTTPALIPRLSFSRPRLTGIPR